MKIVIVGAGKLGYDLAKILSEEQHDVTVIDKDPGALEAIADNLDVLTVAGNVASARTLQDTDIAGTDIMLAVTDNDELNMIACMTTKQLGVRMTVARVRNPDYSSTHPLVPSYSRFGIDLAVNPEQLAAQEVFRLVEVPMASDLEYFADGRLSLIGLRIEDDLAVNGKRIREIQMDRFTIVAIVRRDEVVIPGGDELLLPGDKAFVLGKTTGFHDLNGLMRRSKSRFRRAIIAGGGIIAQYLVGLLRNRRNISQIKVIEPNMDRCRILAAEIEGCEVICGDPTKIEVLEEEKLGPNDIFVSLTGSDNSNLVACMQAKRLGAVEIVCGTSREDYIGLAESIGATATVTPRLLTAGTLLKLVRRTNVVSINLLHMGTAEIVELVAEEGSPATTMNLRDLGLSPDGIVGAVIHGSEIIVPRGETRIRPGDHVVISGLKSRVPLIEQRFSPPAPSKNAEE